jgi:hypothetical protein
MIDTMIKSVMKEAICLQSSLNNCSKQELRIFIHPKNEDFVPHYFLVVKGTPKMNEDGSEYEYLDFNRDILNKKFDMMNRKEIVANFIGTFFKTVNDADGIERENIFASISLGADDKILIALYNQGSFVRYIKIEDLFG